jgi:tellurite resistance protein
MEFLIIIIVIVLVIYFIRKAASGKSRPQQSQEPSDTGEDDGVVVSSGPEGSIVIQVSGAGYSRFRQRGLKPVNPDTVWIPPGKPIKIAGKDVPGGMLYVGQHLQSAGGYADIEPSLINPELKVNFTQPDQYGERMSYWPSYSDIDPACRAAFLNWLAGGRKDHDTDIGYVFIFFYGLERRVFADAKESRSAQLEIPLIVEEVKRLLGIYGANGSFNGYANNFLNAVLLMQSPQRVYETLPPEERAGWELPMSLRLGLGQLVSEGKSIPAAWAYSWVMLHPETRLRTPATRCKDEFKKLFKIRYSAKYGDGMKIKPNKTRLKAAFRTASHSLGGIEIPCGDIPDVGRLSGPVNRLREFVEECTDALDPLSRFLGRKPDQADSLEALALLPEELLDSTDHPQSSKIQDWLNGQLGERQKTYVDASELVKMWPRSKEDKLTKKEAISLAHVLEKFGYGLEPDPRFGGANLKAEGKAVLFRLTEDAPKTASQEYRAATVLLHLAASISGADGVVADSERDHLKTHLEDAFEMSIGEKTRLRAHLDWLLHSPPGLAGIKKRVESLKEAEKKVIATFCVSVAGADGYIDPSEIKTLTKFYPILGLAADDVFTHIHSMMSAAPVPSVDGPVTVQRANESAKGYAIPMQPNVDEMRSKGVDLDMSIIQAKLKETAKVTEILESIFQDDEPEKFVPEPVEEDVPTIGSLDAAHTKLLKALVKKEKWSRAEFEELAEKSGLLPDGALDLINDAAYDICDEPLCDGDDPILVEIEVVKEMVA